MGDRFDYRAAVIAQVGPGNETTVEAIAEHLHYNESLHMHEGVADKEPCSYCWLRAGKAIQAIRRAGLALTMAFDVDITAEVAAHVLCHYGAGGYRAGSFTMALIEVIARADPQNRALLALGHPAYVAAVNLIDRTTDGVAKLSEIAGAVATDG